MYIRAIVKKKEIISGKEKGVIKTYEYLQLVETFRTPKGPRQKLLLNLGPLDIEKSEHKAFVKALECRLRGQINLIPEKTNGKLQALVEVTYTRFLEKKSDTYVATEAQDFEQVDKKSYRSDNHVSVGGEYLCNTIWDSLRLSEWLKEQGVSERMIATMHTLVLGRLLAPSSELATYEWANTRSAVQEFQPGESMSLSQYYRAGDALFELKKKLETYLSQTERSLFNLTEKLVFYDLTNTYLEGQALSNKKAQRGRSKEKRSDCKLLTLGLIVDENGFAKHSELFSGNQAECKTLQDMIKSLEGETSVKGRTVVLDAGIATLENTQWLKSNGYHYIASHRGACPFELEELDRAPFSLIRHNESKHIQISLQQKDHEGERFLVCHSTQREMTDSGIRSLQESRFLEALTYYKEGLSLPKRAKTFLKISEMIGRLKEKYSRIAKLYTIDILIEQPPSDSLDTEPLKLDHKKSLVTTLTWKKNQPIYDAEIATEGQYILRTDRLDLSQDEIWNTYIMLTRIEASFRSLKSHLGLRPNFHQLEDRADAHLFISVLAYHILHIIEFKLRNAQDHRSWNSIRIILSTHQRYSLHYNSLVENALVQNHLRLNSDPSIDHLAIYSVFNLDGRPFSFKAAAFKM